MGLCRRMQVCTGVGRCITFYTLVHHCTPVHTIAHLHTPGNTYAHNYAHSSMANIRWFRWVWMGMCRCMQVCTGDGRCITFDTLAHHFTTVHIIAHLCTLKYNKYTLV